MMFSTIPLYFIRIKEPLLPKKTPISLPKVFDIAPFAFATSFIAGMLINGFFSMSSVFILLQGFDAKAVSYFIACAMVGGFLGQSFIGFISDKLGRKFAIMICSLSSFCSMAVFLIFDLSLGSLFAPLSLGIIMQYFGYHGFNWFYLVVLAFLMLFGINKPNILKKKKYQANPGNMAIFRIFIDTRYKSKIFLRIFSYI